jgi:hypothetical protein
VSKVIFCLTGKTDDERRSHRRIRGLCTNSADEVKMFLTAAGSAHRPQQRRGGVLQAEIEVVCDGRMPGHDVDQSGTDLSRIQVVQAEPFQTLDIGGILHECFDASCPVVPPVRGEVLCHEHNLLDASGNQTFDFGDDARARPGSLLATDEWDRTE